MKLVAIALVLFFGAVLSGEWFQAQGRTQTDWYSRGIVRRQTIKVGTARQKRNHLKRKKRKPTIRHPTSIKS